MVFGGYKGIYLVYNLHMRLHLVKSCQYLLIINIAFWLFMSFYHLIGSSNYLVIKILLFMEVILYSISLIGVSNKIKLIYLGSIILAFGNTVLSLTDQIGVVDIMSFVLSLLAFVNLLIIWKHIFRSF